MTLYRAERLANCDLDLITLWTTIGQTTDCIVIQGARSYVEEQQAIANGKSTLKNPLDSKHVIDPVQRPAALAVDVAPYPVDWNDISGFLELGRIAKAAAEAAAIAIVWGGDWVHFKDYDHFELVHAHGTKET